MNTELAPRHLRLREMLFRRWKTNGVKTGDKIESQNEIIKFCGFSLITVIKTLKDLEAEGIIRRQVGKGSFLTKTPWSEAHWRIGFFYNRDIVGGGIFDNEFYTKLVVAFEKGIVSEGHEFILGSFTHQSIPVSMWDALDAVILIGISDETDLTPIEETSSQVSLFDMMLDDLPLHSYQLDFGPAFDAMFRHVDGQDSKVLYLDSKIASPEQALRKSAFSKAYRTFGAGSELLVISVNQETEADDTTQLEAAIADFAPDIVCGYLHRTWHELILEQSKKDVDIYAFALDSDQPGFVVDSAEWMQQIIPIIYDNLQNRQAAPAHQTFPAKFVP